MNTVVASLGLTGWEHWAYFATIVAVLVNGAFLYFLIQQVKQGQEAQKDAKRAADAAQHSVREALYARIDQQAPRVIALLDNPVIGATDSKTEIDFLAKGEFVLPRDKSTKLYVGTTGTLVNEGKSTARVTLIGSAQWMTDEDDEFQLIGQIAPSTDAYILSPGEQVRFLWSEAHILDDWADAFTNSSPANPRGACFLEIIATDYFEEGVIDHIFLEMSGRPLVPIDGDTSHWHVPDKAEFAAMSYPIKRAHIREENGKITPSWLETYKDWNKQRGND